MVIRNQGEALCVACEMERRAIRIYERALCLAQEEEVRRGIREIKAEEERHLYRFQEMRKKYGETDCVEERVLIAAMAAETLFPGGVMEMNREEALQSLQKLYAYARDSEAEAVRTYTEFAEKCAQPEVREAFLAIAREERMHLVSLEDKVHEAAVR